MSKIKNVESYKKLSHVFVLDSKLNLKDLGVYDKEQGIEFDLGYRKGQFTNIFGKVEYDDSKLDGKPTVRLAFIHKYFGNGSKIGKGHIHERYLVSCNDINLFNIYTQTRDGNILFFADIVNTNSINGGEFSLVELKPYLEIDELIRLKNDIDEAKLWKSRMMELQKECETAKMDLYIANAQSFAACGANEQSKTAIRRYQKQNENMRQVMLDVTLGASQKIIDGIEKVEGEMDLGLNWHDMNKGMIEKSIGVGEVRNNFINSLDEFKNGGMTDSMKTYAIENIIEICGIDYVKNIVDSYSSNGKNYNNMTKVIIRLQEMRDRNEISAAQFNEFSGMVNNRAESNFASNNGNINSAVESAAQSMGLNDEQMTKLRKYIE